MYGINFILFCYFGLIFSGFHVGKSTSPSGSSYGHDEAKDARKYYIRHVKCSDYNEATLTKENNWQMHYI